MVVTRFAPSPTGHLHIGGARTAIFSWLLARAQGGKFFLRIEDTDTLRSNQEMTDSILAALDWLGLDYDGEPVYQSQRYDLYNKYIDELLDKGQAYYCSCTPDEVEAMRERARATGQKPKYDGRCREAGLGPGPDRVVRLKAPLEGRTVVDDAVKGPVAFENSELDDMILRRADGSPTYNLAVVVDDADDAGFAAQVVSLWRDSARRQSLAARAFADAQGYRVNWDEVIRLDDISLINGVSQIAPFDAASKQALLEADGVSDRCRLLVQLMQFYGRRDGDEGLATLQ